MNKSDEIKDLATALAKAQGQIKDALRDSNNPFFHSTYADLAAVWEACRKPLSDNGLSIIQSVTSEAEVYSLETYLLHSTGQFFHSAVKLMLTYKEDKQLKENPTMQGLGSAITYARRYQLAAFVGVAPDDDDDGNAASGRTTESSNKAVREAINPRSAVSDKSQHWCAKHQTNWFMRGNMKTYSHPVNDPDGKTLTWCSEPKPEARFGDGVSAGMSIDAMGKSQDAPPSPEEPPAVAIPQPEPPKPSVAPTGAQREGVRDLAWVIKAMQIVRWSPGTLVSWVNAQILTPDKQPILGAKVQPAQVWAVLTEDQRTRVTDHLNAMAEAS